MLAYRAEKCYNLERTGHFKDQMRPPDIQFIRI